MRFANASENNRGQSNSPHNPSILADIVASSLRIGVEEKQQLLETISSEDRELFVATDDPNEAVALVESALG